MEKKTMGGLIAALRKANGMTQKDLGDRLNVSDKTISRWERDEGCPDLSAIPAIAEIFDISCDELLRGQRRPPEQRTDLHTQAEASAKAEKQRQRMLALSLNQYKNKTDIVMGLGVLGLIGAAICNLAFLRAFLGFWVGCVFFAAALVCQAIFWNNAAFGISEENPADPAVNHWKRTAIGLTKRAMGVCAGMWGFTLPLLLGGTYSGLVESWPLFGLMGTALCLMVYGVVCWFVNAAQLKKGLYTLPEQESTRFWHNHNLKKRCVLALAGVLVVTFVAHQLATNIWGPFTIMEGITFEDYESFADFMAQDIPLDRSPGNLALERPQPDEMDGIYYDQYGNEITEEEAHTVTLTDKNGEEVFRYVNRNESVISTRYIAKEGTVLPITVYTQQALETARQKAALRHVVFAGLYCAEAAATLLYYFKKRMK